MKKLSPCLLALLQALGLVGYCALVGVLFWQGSRWFGQVPNFWGPLLFLVLFVVSALVCGLLALGYPIYLFWIKQQKRKALKLVVATAGWLVLFTLLLMLMIVFKNASRW